MKILKRCLNYFNWWAVLVAALIMASGSLVTWCLYYLARDFFECEGF